MTSKNPKARHPIFGTSPVPLYLQLAEIFRQRIGRDIWTAGDMLPSIESLMKEFIVARITVRQAIRLLSDEGLVTAQRGKGTFVNEVNGAQRLLRVHTTLAGLVDMYRGDKPVLTNLEESDAIPELLESDGIAAPGYIHFRRVHARDDIRYCVISIYIAEQVFRMAESDFRNEVVLPILFSLPEIDIKSARQTMHISKADAEIANLLAIPVGEPMAEVRRVITAPDNTVIYLAEVSYRGDYIHLDMDLKP